MIDPKQGPLPPASAVTPNAVDAEVDYLQWKTGMTRAAIVAAIRRVGHDRRAILTELRIDPLIK